jgi:hypothetical protein
MHPIPAEDSFPGRGNTEYRRDQYKRDNVLEWHAALNAPEELNTATGRH